MISKAGIFGSEAKQERMFYVTLVMEYRRCDVFFV